MKETELGVIKLDTHSIHVYKHGIAVNCNGNLIPLHTFSEKVVNLVMKLVFTEGYSCVQGVITKATEPFEGVIIIGLPYPIELPKSKILLETTKDIDLYIGYYGITGELEEATKGLNVPKGTNWFNTLKLLGKK